MLKFAVTIAWQGNAVTASANDPTTAQEDAMALAIKYGCPRYPFKRTMFSDNGGYNIRAFQYLVPETP